MATGQSDETMGQDKRPLQLLLIPMENFSTAAFSENEDYFWKDNVWTNTTFDRLNKINNLFYSIMS